MTINVITLNSIQTTNTEIIILKQDLLNTVKMATIFTDKFSITFIRKLDNLKFYSYELGRELEEF